MSGTGPQLTGKREIVVFLPRVDDQAPGEVAHELVTTLDVGSARVGEDLLAGGVTVRLPYDPELLERVKALLGELSATCEIDLR